MGAVKIQHQELAEGRWAKLPLALQMGNIGSEVSRSLKWYKKTKNGFRYRLSGLWSCLICQFRVCRGAKKGNCGNCAEPGRSFVIIFLGAIAGRPIPRG